MRPPDTRPRPCSSTSKKALHWWAITSRSSVPERGGGGWTWPPPAGHRPTVILTISMQLQRTWSVGSTGCRYLMMEWFCDRNNPFDRTLGPALAGAGGWPGAWVLHSWTHRRQRPAGPSRASAPAATSDARRVASAYTGPAGGGRRYPRIRTGPGPGCAGHGKDHSAR